MAIVPPLLAEFQPFDSGKIAPRVGSVILGESALVDPESIGEMLESAAADALDLVWIESRSKIESLALDYRGTIVELVGDRDEALSKIQVPDRGYDIRVVECESDWARLVELLPFTAKTRFSTDPNISEISFREHKLSLLKSHVENRKGMVTITYSPDDPLRPIGYCCTSVDQPTMIIYDIAVDPSFRRGFVGFSLVRFHLERFASIHPAARRLCTRIYEENTACLQLFYNVGMMPTGRLFHYYHCWPMHSAALPRSMPSAPAAVNTGRD